MPEYVPLGSLPVYTRMRATLIRMRDEVFEPMRKQVQQARDELAREKERLETEREAARSAAAGPQAAEARSDGPCAGEAPGGQEIATPKG